ncbi:MAG: alpha-L-fucosidase, partial [Flavobacteriales bacterium]
QIGNLPLETCETINHSWGFNLQDGNHKSAKELIQYLIKAAGNNANFLLNIGPMPNGAIQQEHKERLKELGAWLDANGESIYDTRGGEYQNDSMVSTQKGKELYLHILDKNFNSISIPQFKNKIKQVVYFSDATPLNYTLKNGKLSFDIDSDHQSDLDTIIKITLK